MKSEINRINSQFIQIEDYVRPTSVEGYESLIRRDGAGFNGNFSKAQKSHELAQGELMRILPQMDPKDIATAYTEGGRLIRYELAGFMYSNFDEAFLLVMRNAIEEDDGNERAYLFLAVFQNKLGIKSLPIILKAIESRFPCTRDKALGVICELQALEAIPSLEKLVLQITDHRLADYASKCLEQLLSKARQA